MDLQADVDVVADRLAIPPHVLDRAVDLRRVGLEVGLAALLVQERVQVTDGRVPALLRLDALLDLRLDGAAP